MKKILILLVFSIVLYGCTIGRGYADRIKYKTKIDSNGILVITWIEGFNLLFSSKDSVKVWLTIEVDTPVDLCDSLLVDDIKWVTNTNQVLMHVTPGYPKNYGEYHNVIQWLILLKKGATFYSMEIPMSLSKTTLLITSRFVKNGIVSKQHVINVPINTKRKLGLLMLLND